MCKPESKEISSRQRSELQRSAPSKPKVVSPTHSAGQRCTDYDVFYFLVPALFWKLTPVLPVYMIAISRIICANLILSLHYMFVDKDNYQFKITQKQLQREKDDYMVAFVLHMWVQIALQLVFPTMFFSETADISVSAIKTFASHVLLVEPLYYWVHRWLHIPAQMKAMHGHHHMSIITTPTTALVQNFQEHFVYIATFGPAFFLPFFTGGTQHWTVIWGYLLMFDILNTYGHTNIRINNWIFNNKYSPIRYLFYTPEFHLGHHAYFNANYALFMPIWDHLFGTFREYQKPVEKSLPPRQQDFVFIGHNGGLGHLFTCPELVFYNVYNRYARTFLPMQLEFLIMHIICQFAKLIMKSYECSRFLVNQKYIGRVMVIIRTPWDYMTPSSYPAINNDLVNLMREQYKKCGTRCFGLGNLNKMQQLNEGGAVIVELIKKDPFLKDKNIRIWTGDTLTAASVYHQILDFPNLNEFFFIGANGKVGKAVCEMLLKTRPELTICIFSSYHGIKHPRVHYTTDLRDMAKYKLVVVGKLLATEKYAKALRASKHNYQTRYILDYTVPCFPIQVKECPEVQHVQIGVLRMTDMSNRAFLKGSYDMCMSLDEHQIYPCHAGCLINMVEHREDDEIGEIEIDKIEDMWTKAVSYGFQNKFIDYR